MHVLDTRQSKMLKQISANPIPYNSLTDEEKELCAFLLKMQYVTYQTQNKTASFDGVFQVFNEIETVSISEKGKMYLINEQLSEEQRQYLKEQIASLKEMATSAQKQADSADTQAKLAIDRSKKLI